MAKFRKQTHEGIVFTRDRILDSVWGCDYYGDDRTVDTHIKRMRSIYSLILSISVRFTPATSSNAFNVI